ncbi:MAG: hypothetical protein Q9221_003540 [Calogaya cf. arnoldii]
MGADAGARGREEGTKGLSVPKAGAILGQKSPAVGKSSLSRAPDREDDIQQTSTLGASGALVRVSYGKSSKVGANTTFNPTGLEAALKNERSLRLAAEDHLSTIQNEIKDLSTSVFSEANELVTVERRALHELQTRYDALQEEVRGLRDREGEWANGIAGRERIGPSMMVIPRLWYVQHPIDINFSNMC